VRFVEVCPAILHTLDILEQSNDAETSDKPDLLSQKSKEFEFVAGTHNRK